MVDVANRRCAQQGCQKAPLFNFPGQLRRLYCADHKAEGMVNLRLYKATEANLAAQQQAAAAAAAASRPAVSHAALMEGMAHHPAAVMGLGSIPLMAPGLAPPPQHPQTLMQQPPEVHPAHLAHHLHEQAQHAQQQQQQQQVHELQQQQVQALQAAGVDPALQSQGQLIMQLQHQHQHQLQHQHQHQEVPPPEQLHHPEMGTLPPHMATHVSAASHLQQVLPHTASQAVTAAAVVPQCHGLRPDMKVQLGYNSDREGA